MPYTCPFPHCRPAPFQKSSNWFRHCASQRHVTMQAWHELNRTECHSRWNEVVTQTNHDQQFMMWLACNPVEQQLFNEAKVKAHAACKSEDRPFAPEGALSDEMEFRLFQTPTAVEAENTESMDFDPPVGDSDGGEIDLNLPVNYGKNTQPDDAFIGTGSSGQDLNDSDKYWQPSHWFKPSVSNPYVRHPDGPAPDNAWFPWPSEVFFLLYTLVHGRGVTVSEKTLRVFWYILKKVANPEVSIPSLNTIKRFRKNIPEPRIYRHETKETTPSPYHQISLCDQIRMQMAIPSVGRKLQEDALVDIVNHSRTDLWTGDKWKSTPQLQRPFVTLTSLAEAGSGSGISPRRDDKEMWFGEVFKVCLEGHGRSNHNGSSTSPTGSGYAWGVFRSHYQARASFGSDESMTVICYQPLEQLQPGVLGIRMKSLGPGVNPIDAASNLRECLSDSVQESFTAVQHLVGDSDSGVSKVSEVLVVQLHDNGTTEPISDTIFNQLFGEHPVRQNRRRVQTDRRDPMPIRVVNISLWQDDLAGNRSKKWNPHTCTTARLAGTTDANIMMLSVVKDLNGKLLWAGVVEELKRLMRGILTYDASLNRTVLVTGGLVQFTADNPAHSEICCHSWKGDFPCRKCEYSPKDTSDTSPSRILKIGKLRDAHECRLYLQEGIDVLGIRSKSIIPDLHYLQGFDVYHDTPWERLHCWLLGPLKEVNRSLINWTAVKSLKGDMKQFVDALNWDGFDGPIAGRRVTQWLASFVGKDHRDFSQMVPLIMDHFLRSENLDTAKFGGSNNVSTTLELLALLGTMTVMLYMRVIPDIRLWQQQWIPMCQRLVELLAIWHHDTDHGVSPASNNVGTSSQPEVSTLPILACSIMMYNSDLIPQTIPKAAINIYGKPKFHLLCHVPEYIKSFGCTRNSMTEHEEHLNSTVRNWLVLSNRQAPSLDTARRFSAADGLLFVIRGGVWCYSGQPHRMTTAGRSVLHAIEMDKELREMAGFQLAAPADSHRNPEPGMYCGPFESYQRLQYMDLSQAERHYFAERSIGSETLRSYRKAHLSDGATLKVTGFFSLHLNSSTMFRAVRILSGENLNHDTHQQATPSVSHHKEWWVVGRQLKLRSINPESESAGGSRTNSDLESSVMGCSVWEEVPGEHSLMVFGGSRVRLEYNFQHLCDKNCGPVLDEQGRRVERELIRGTIWKHSDSGVFVANRFKIKSG